MKSRILMAGLAALAGWCAGCRSGKPERPVMDEPMRLARDAAQADYRAGRYDGAAESWTRAIDRAYVLGDAAAAARFRYQQAASRLAAGRLEEGESLLRLAGLEALAAGESVLAARAGTAEARLALKRGRPAEARELALKAQATAGAKADSLLKADIELILAEAGLATPEGLPEARRH